MKKLVVLSVFLTAIGFMVAPLTSIQISSAASALLVPTQFPTIQAAINAASSGNTIKVLPGTYTEQITISKNLIIVGSGKSTIIKTPTALNNNVLGRPYIVDINSHSKVILTGFTIKGPDGTTCPRLLGVSVVEDASLNLESVSIKGCIQTGVLVGAGPQVGHATIRKTVISDYRNVGIFAFGDTSTISVSESKITAAENSEVSGQVGIEILIGAKGIVSNNKISGNICNNPDCGPDFFTELQAFGIGLLEVGKGSIISNNDVSNNDAGIGVGGNSGCCKVHNNKLTDNRFFGITIFDGAHTSSQDKISGGSVGIAAIATSENTIATVVNDKITGTTTPTQELSCCGVTAKIIIVPPGGFKVSQSQVNIKSSQAHKLLEKKFGKLD